MAIHLVMDKSAESVSIVGKLLVYSVGVFAFTTLVLHAALYLDIPFAPFAIIVTAIILVGLAFLIGSMKGSVSYLANLCSAKYVYLLLLLAILSGALTCAINAPEEDDSLYIPFAIQSLADPYDPLTNHLKWIVPFASGEMVQSPLVSIFSGLVYFWAAISYVSGVPFLILYHILGSFLFGAAFPVIYFYLISRLVPEEKAVFIGTLCVTMAGFLIFREHNIGYGIALNKIWLAKTVLLTLLIPLFAAFSFDYLKSPTWSNWLLLALAAVASTGLSASALFILPLLITAISLGNLLRSSGEHQDRFIRRFQYSLLLGLSSFYPLIIAGYVKIHDPIVEGVRIHANSIGPSQENLFRASFTIFGEYPLSVTCVCVALSVIYLLILNRSSYWLLIGWFLAAISLFVNPWTTNYVAQHITSTVAYNRVFFLIPVFAVVGVAIGALVSLPAPRRKIHIYVMIGIFSLYMNFQLSRIASHHDTDIVSMKMVSVVTDILQARMRLDVIKTPIWENPRFGIPDIKFDPSLAKDIRHIQEILPPGKTLSSVDYAIAIPIMTINYPQYYLWPITVISVYGLAQNQLEDAVIREGAGLYLLGDTSHERQFLKLLDSNVENFIVSKRLPADTNTLKSFALSRGFRIVEETNRYILCSRREHPYP